MWCACSLTRQCPPESLSSLMLLFCSLPYSKLVTLRRCMTFLASQNKNSGSPFISTSIYMCAPIELLQYCSNQQQNQGRYQFLSSTQRSTLLWKLLNLTALYQTLALHSNKYRYNTSKNFQACSYFLTSSKQECPNQT